MDLLKEGMKNISLYEVKKQVRKAQNVVLNYSEMEGKVREATNNEPWGTSSKKMQEIASGTYNYREREEICGMIFRRFTEKAANEWRQIYKSLILLEYLIKHGSERFVDDARANMSLISMLKSFHYIDSQGRDQGINIRNRSKLLLGLLNDENKIRAERKKARENAKKFGGVSGGAAPFGGSQRVGGFESEDGYDGSSFGGSTSQVYGDGGMFGHRTEEARGTNGASDDFEEYDDGSTQPAPPSKITRTRPQRTTETQAKQAPPAKDLFSFDDDDEPPAKDDDDDFDDFQSAEPVTNTGAGNNVAASLGDLYAGSTSITAAAPLQNIDLLGSLSFNSTTTTTTTTATTAPTTSYNYNNSVTPAIANPQSTNDAFSSLFSSAKSHASTVPKAPEQKTAQPSAQPKTSNANDLDLLSF